MALINEESRIAAEIVAGSASSQRPSDYQAYRTATPNRWHKGRDRRAALPSCAFAYYGESI